MNFPFRRSNALRAGILLLAVFLVATAAIAATAAPAQADPRIVGGQEADPGEWPWQVALVLANGDNYNGQFCGGTIIAADWVLTAAHCITEWDPDPDLTPGDLDVVAGIHDLMTPDAGFVRVDVAEIIVHSGWNNATHDNDIALLRLATPIPERAAAAGQLPIQYATLPAASIGDLAGATTTVTGWGTRIPGASDRPERLYEVALQVIANADCASAYSNLTDNMLCAGVPGGGKDSCQGDSGGPMVYNDSGQWRLVGVVSFGVGCGLPDYPGVYARVTRYIDWIIPLVATDLAYVPVALYVPPAGPPPPPPDPLENGDFEQGAGVGWSESSTHGWPIVTDDFTGEGNVITPIGVYGAWLGGDYDDVSALWQQITIAADAPVLRYTYAIGSADICGYDWAEVRVNGTDVHRHELCGDTTTSGWVAGSIDLSAYAGQNVELLFIVFTDGSENSNLFLDNVTFSNARAAAEPVGPRLSSGDLAAPKSR